MPRLNRCTSLNVSKERGPRRRDCRHFKESSSADLLPLPRREQIPRDEVDEGRGGRRLVVPVSPPPAPLLQSRRGAPREGPRPFNDVGPVKISYTLHFSVFSFNQK